MTDFGRWFLLRRDEGVSGRHPKDQQECDGHEGVK